MITFVLEWFHICVDSSQERRREDERRRTQEIKFSKEDMERVRLSMNGDYTKATSPTRDNDNQSRYVARTATKNWPPRPKNYGARFAAFMCLFYVWPFSLNSRVCKQGIQTQPFWYDCDQGWLQFCTSESLRKWLYAALFFPPLCWWYVPYPSHFISENGTPPNRYC